jgi:hypothetical protein
MTAIQRPDIGTATEGCEMKAILTFCSIREEPVLVQKFAIEIAQLPGY